MLDLWWCLMHSPQIRRVVGCRLRCRLSHPSQKKMGSTCIIYLGNAKIPQEGLMLRPMYELVVG